MLRLAHRGSGEAAGDAVHVDPGGLVVAVSYVTEAKFGLEVMVKL